MARMFRNQIIKEIPVQDLVLWTENPRDPINDGASDLDVLKRALSQEGKKKWKLDSLIKSMGKDYDYSELPTVVYHNHKPIVYDGNRRIVLGKIKLGLIPSGTLEDFNINDIPEYPEKIPCNVCDEKTAIEHVYRKHGANGSWDALESERFLNKYINKNKSVFLVFDDCFKCISNNDNMNQDYVRDEILNEINIKKLGFAVKEGKLFSKHSYEDSKKIIDNIVSKVGKDITTRKNRGNILGVLDDDIKKIIDNDKNNGDKEIGIQKANDSLNQENKIQRLNRRTQDKEQIIFGEKLPLRQGDVNNLYRDICDLYSYWIKCKDAKNPSIRLSPTFPSLIRMSLRLIVETAAKDNKTSLSIEQYVKKHYSKAKEAMTQDQKTTLFLKCPGGENNIIALLQTGAHNYSAANDIIQTLSLSELIGKMLLISHGLNYNKTNSSLS